jgi:hypothetical protein
LGVGGGTGVGTGVGVGGIIVVFTVVFIVEMLDVFTATEGVVTFVTVVTGTFAMGTASIPVYSTHCLSSESHLFGSLHSTHCSPVS